MKLWIIGIIFLLLLKSLVTTSDESEGSEGSGDDCDPNEDSGDDGDECTIHKICTCCRTPRKNGCSVKIISHSTVSCCSTSLSIRKKEKSNGGGKGLIKTTYCHCRTITPNSKVVLKRTKTKLSRRSVIGILSKPVIAGSSTSIGETLTMETSTLIVTPSSIMSTTFLAAPDLSISCLKTMATTRLTVTPSSINTKFVSPDLSTSSLKTVETSVITSSSINTTYITPDTSTWHEPSVFSTVFSEMKSEVLFSSSSTLPISGSHRYPLSSEIKSPLRTKSSVLDSKWPHSSSVYPTRSMTSSITNTHVTERETSSRTSTLTEISSVVTTIATTNNLSSTWPVTSVIILPTKSKEVPSSSVEMPKVVFCSKSITGEKRFKGVLKWNKTMFNTTSQLPCPYGPPGEKAVRKCEIHLGVWSDVNDTMCATRPSCSDGKSGDSFQNGILHWQKTAIGMRANEPCPYNDKHNKKIAYRWCRMNSTDLKPFWDTIHNANCSILQRSNVTVDKLVDTEINKGNERRIAALINYFTSHLNMSVDVVNKGADVMKNLVEKATDLYQISTDLLNLVSNVMNINSSTLAAANRQKKSTEKILRYIGRMMENINLTGGKSCCQPVGNVISKALDLSNSTNKLISFPSDSSDAEVSITLPSSLVKRYQPGQRVYFFNFKNDKLFPRLKNSKEIFINSEIVSATIKGKPVYNLSDPVVIEFKLNDIKYSGNSSCVFWDFEADGGDGAWSKNGCKFEMIDKGWARCSCNHLTHFGILVDLFPGTTNAQRIYLEKITFIGCYLSIVGLVITMITLLSFKKYRASISGKILFNLCLALLIALSVFVAGIERAEGESSCVAIAALLHYFILVVFFWMGIEAFYMFLNIVLDRLSDEHGNIFVLKCAAIAWVLPMFIVLITVLMKTDDYKDQSLCRVSGNSFYIAFLVPVLTILIFNFIIFILVIKSLLSDTMRAERRSRGLVHFRRVLGIMTVLGITWIFGILAVGDVRIVFQYLFCISTSLQGFLIFVIYCMTDRNVRERLVRLLCVLPDPNRVNDSSSTQQPTDIVINLDQFEPADRSLERYRSGEERSLSWINPQESGARPRINVALPDEPVDELVARCMVNIPFPSKSGNQPRVNVPLTGKPDVMFSDSTVVRPKVNVPLSDEPMETTVVRPRVNVPLSDEPVETTAIRPRVNVPLSDEPMDATVVRPRVNVPLSDEPASGVDELVRATLSQSGLMLQQSIGETSIRSADGSIIFFDNGRIVDVPRYPEIEFGESPSRPVSKKRRRASKNKEGVISDTSKDLRRWSEMGWSPRLKNYSQNLPDDVKPDDGLKEIDLSQFKKSEPKPFGTEKRQGAPVELPVRLMADDDVEIRYFEKYREDLGNVDGSLNNSVASALASGPIASTSNVERNTKLNVEQQNLDSQQNSDSTESDSSSSNSSLKFSEIHSHWIPGPRSLSRSTIIFRNDEDDDDDVGQDKMSHFQEL